MDEHARLKFFPVSFFAVIMGLTGFAIALQRAETILNFPAGFGQIFTWLSAGIFILLIVLYAGKLLRFRQEVQKELAHPIRLSFFPTVSISIVLLSIALHPTNSCASFLLFVVGASLHLVFTLYVLSRWIGQTTFEIHHSNPSWFIPVVGNILIPIVGVEYELIEISWFFFSVGLMFWLVFQTIIFNRIIFHHPLPERLVPTLFILIAPPAVGFIAYVKLVGAVDNVARVLYYFALFIVLLLVTLYRKFYGIKFFLSWWAYSFPLAAITMASMLMFSKTGMNFYQFLSWFFLAVLGIVIAMLTIKTLKAVANREICVEE
jgi:tellurite resistance protein